MTADVSICGVFVHPLAPSIPLDATSFNSGKLVVTVTYGRVTARHKAVPLPKTPVSGAGEIRPQKSFLEVRRNLNSRAPNSLKLGGLTAVVNNR